MSHSPAPAPAPALLDLAVRAARLGGGELLRRVHSFVQTGAKSSPTDPVTDADLASESAVVGLLTSERPADGLLGEEGAERTSRSGLRWVVDPLDGTVNYLYGIPHSAVSIACQRADGDGWQTIVGVVYDVARDEMFTAARGQGSRLNGEPLSVNNPVGLSSALVTTGFSYRSGARARQAAVLPALLPAVRDIRSSGSAALDLAWVAAGRCDACYEDELALWDRAAGELIVTEAGGIALPFDDGVIAAGPALYPGLRALVTAGRHPLGRSGMPQRGGPFSASQVRD
ncbi:inositol monophosphatase family protein [Streptomyces sp. NPDC020898]|uniref:inositol monophosphatase family protein n=1 Tax=Streptomyces sp. NPDC020898 TaxID=3365101 RepID=UPI0037BB425C